MSIRPRPYGDHGTRRPKVLRGRERPVARGGIHAGKPKLIGLLGTTRRLVACFRRHTPVVQQAADVAYIVACGLFEAPQDEIMILHAVVLSVKASNAARESRLHHQKASKLILSDEKVPVEIRLEIGRVKDWSSRCVRADSVLIRVEHLASARLQQLHYAEQRVVGQLVSRFEKAQIVTLGAGNGAIQADGMASKVTDPNPFDPRIIAKYVIDGLADFGGAARRVVADEKFPPIVSLARDAAQAALDQDGISICRP